jgi:hypothetical protein
VRPSGVLDLSLHKSHHSPADATSAVLRESDAVLRESDSELVVSSRRDTDPDDADDDADDVAIEGDLANGDDVFAAQAPAARHTASPTAESPTELREEPSTPGELQERSSAIYV